MGAALRRKDAEPHLVHLRLGGPETKKFIEITGSLCDLRGDRAVNGYPRVTDALENPFVSGGFAPRVMLRLQAIYRNHNIQLAHAHPGAWNYSECARDHLGMHTAAFDLWQQHVDLAVPHHGISADQRDMKRLVLVDQREHSGDEFFSLEVGEFA